MLVACARQADPPGEAPGGVAVAPGDGVAVVSWNQLPDLTYWIIFRAGSTVAPTTPSVSLLRSVQSPRVVANLVNGTQYAFVMNATREDSPAGPASPVVLATPRLAGGTWNSGAALGTIPANLNAVAFNGSKIVAVGDSGTIFAGDFNYTSANPPGVTAWAPPTAVPTGFVKDFSAAVFTGAGFAILAKDGSVLTGSDGLTWVAANAIPSGAVTMNGIALGVSVLVAVGSGGTIFASADSGVNWTLLASPTTADLNSVAFVGGVFIACGAGGTLVTSPDGLSWTSQTSGSGNSLRGATFGIVAGQRRYVAVGDAGAIVTSSDALTWAPATTSTGQNLRSVVFGSRFLAVGQGGAVAYSDDGLAWTPASAGAADLNAALFAPAMYLAVGVSGANAVSR